MQKIIIIIIKTLTFLVFCLGSKIGFSQEEKSPIVKTEICECVCCCCCGYKWNDIDPIYNNFVDASRYTSINCKCCGHVSQIPKPIRETPIKCTRCGRVGEPQKLFDYDDKARFKTGYLSRKITTCPTCGNEEWIEPFDKPASQPYWPPKGDMDFDHFSHEKPCKDYEIHGGYHSERTRIVPEKSQKDLYFNSKPDSDL